MSNTIPNTHEVLLAKVNKEGFVFFKGMDIPEALHAHFFNRDNYDSGDSQEPNAYDCLKIESPISDFLTATLWARFPYLSNAGEVSWDAKFMYSHYELGRHREFSKSGRATIYLITWLTPYPFEGREFVYGSLEDPNDTEAPVCHSAKNSDTTFSFVSTDNPGIITLGSVRPETGLCCFLDRRDPKWWHAVNRMTSGGPVVVLGATIQ